MAQRASKDAPRRQRVAETRVEQQPAFVLHATPWRETSLILDVITRDFGRIALVARGAKRPTSQFRGLLCPFGSLAIGWTGRSEMRTLTRVEWLGALSSLKGEALFAAFYVNELIVRMMVRDDPHPGLYRSYVFALAALSDRSSDDRSLEAALRCFELDLLKESGHAPQFEMDADGKSVLPDVRYRVDPENGVIKQTGRSLPALSAGDDQQVDGRVLLALAQRDFGDVTVRLQARDVLRGLIRYHLQGRPLNTRRILQDLKSI